MADNTPDHFSRTSDGVNLRVHDLGGGGTPLLLAHATGMHGLVWPPLAHQLVAHSLAFDARGHGDSGASPSGVAFTWDELATDVLAVIEHLGLDRPFGMGHSSGGTALLLAEQTRPGLFRGLYLYEPVLVPLDTPPGRDPDNALAAAARRRRRCFASRDEAFAHYRSKRPLDSLMPDALQAFVDYGFNDLPDGQVELKCQADHEATVYETATASSCYARLQDVKCPVVLASGDASVAFSRGLLDAQAARLANCSIEIFGGLGHLGPLEEPERIARSVNSFAEGGHAP